MLLLYKISMALAFIGVTIVIFIPILCFVDFVLKNALYLSEAIIDEIVEFLEKKFGKPKKEKKK